MIPQNVNTGRSCVWSCGRMARLRHPLYGATFCSEDCLVDYERATSNVSVDSCPISSSSSSSSPLSDCHYLYLSLARQLRQESDTRYRELLHKQLCHVANLLPRDAFRDDETECTVVNNMLTQARLTAHQVSDTNATLIDPLDEALKLTSTKSRVELARTTTAQCVVQRVEPGGAIGVRRDTGVLPERHPGITQCIQVLEGQCKVILSDDADARTVTASPALYQGSVLVVPPDQYHLVRNTGSVPLLIFSVYSPPEPD